MSRSDPYIDSFAEVLRQQREAQGFSQENLALAVGLDRTFISLLERGRRKPSYDTLVRISRALDMKPEDFVAECGRGYLAAHSKKH